MIARADAICPECGRGVPQLIHTTDGPMCGQCFSRPQFEQPVIWQEETDEVRGFDPIVGLVILVLATIGAWVVLILLIVALRAVVRLIH